MNILTIFSKLDNVQAGSALGKGSLWIWFLTFIIGSFSIQLEKDSSEESSTECLDASGETQLRMTENCELYRIDFEVYGEVQGVFFRKYTQQEANKLGLRGFCRNTRAGTVSGSLEGPRQAIDQMKHWLEHTGSPMSRISNAVFKNEKKIEAFTFSPGFTIAKTA